MRLPRGSIRATAQPYLEGLASRGLSANAALTLLREKGLGYRRADFLADYRKYQGREIAKGRGRYVRMDSYPGPSCEVETAGFQRRQYNYVVNYYTTDLDTGETTKHWYIVASDERLTRRAIEESAFDVICAHLDRYNARFENLAFSHTRIRSA